MLVYQDFDREYMLGSAVIKIPRPASARKNCDGRAATVQPAFRGGCLALGAQNNEPIE
jgi:hypothetical protein